MVADQPALDSTPATPADWPYLLFEDPHRYKIGLETYSNTMVLQTWGATLIVTLLAQGCNAWFSELLLPWNTGMGAVWALALLQLPALLVVQRLIRSGQRQGFMWGFVFQSLLQLWWLAWLCWVSVPFVWFPAALLLCGWALHDAWLSNSWKIRAIYAAMFPTFDLLLTIHDFILDDGIVQVASDKPSMLIAALATEVVVTGVLLALMVAVGREGKALEKSQRTEAKLQRELALRNRERQVIQRSCALLAQGLTVSSFSHSLSSPVTALNISLMDLEDLHADWRERLPAPVATELANIIEEQKAATKRIIDMTRGLARSIAAKETTAPRGVGVLLDEALEESRGTIQDHGVELIEPLLTLDESDVWIEQGHVSALSNVLTNGILHASHAPLEIDGERCSPYFYQISIRDRGVSGVERDKAIETIRNLTSMVEWSGSSGDKQPVREGDYRGFGIGLTLTRLHLLRYNGIIEPGIPKEGPGLVFHIILPTIDPSLIPATENQPEQFVDAVPHHPHTIRSHEGHQP